MTECTQALSHLQLSPTSHFLTPAPEYSPSGAVPQPPGKGENREENGERMDRGEGNSQKVRAKEREREGERETEYSLRNLLPSFNNCLSRTFSPFYRDQTSRAGLFLRTRPKKENKNEGSFLFGIIFAPRGDDCAEWHGAPIS